MNSLIALAALVVIVAFLCRDSSAIHLRLPTRRVSVPRRKILLR